MYISQATTYIFKRTREHASIISNPGTPKPGVYLEINALTDNHTRVTAGRIEPLQKAGRTTGVPLHTPHRAKAICASNREDHGPRVSRARHHRLAGATMTARDKKRRPLPAHNTPGIRQSGIPPPCGHRSGGAPQPPRSQKKTIARTLRLNLPTLRHPLPSPERARTPSCVAQVRLPKPAESRSLSQAPAVVLQRTAAMASTPDALLLVALALVLVYVSWLWLKQRRVNLPPGPRPLPVIGSLHLLGSHAPRSLMKLSETYGPVMTVRFGQKLCIVASNSEAAREFLKVQDANFSSRPLLRATELMSAGDLVLHDLTPETRNFKKIFVTELTSAKRLQASKHSRTEEIAYMLRAVSKETGEFELFTYTNILAANLITRLVLCRRLMGAEQMQGGDESASARMVDEEKEFVDLVREYVWCFSQVHPQDFFNAPKWFDPQGLDARFRKGRVRLNAFYANVVSQHKEERRKNPISEGQQTLLDVLLKQLENPEYNYTEEHIISFIWDALAAGVDTMALTAEWVLAEVLRHPAVVEAARAELDRVVGRDRMVQESDIPELKYIQAVVKESLRLHPPTPFLIPHQNIHATTAFGYDIPAKTRLFVNLWAIHRDPKHWENPMEYMPERFLGNGTNAATQFQGQHFELLPFGTGRRQCPGLPFAASVVPFIVASLLHAFDVSLPPGMSPEDLDMTEVQGLTLAKRDRLVIVAKPRLPAHLY